MATCKKCEGTGVIETGNNDLPCDCPAGATAQFNTAGIQGSVTGEELQRYFFNSSPERIRVGNFMQQGPFHASSLPDRRGKINLDELQQEVEKLLALLQDRQPEIMAWHEFMYQRLRSLHDLTSKALRVEA